MAKEESKLKFGSTDLEPDGRPDVDPEYEARMGSLDVYLRECVTIDPLQISAEYIRLPGDLAYWNAQYAEALRAFLRAELSRKVLWARLEPMIRGSIIAKGGKPTEAQVKAAVDGNSDYVEALEAEVEAEVQKNEIYGCLDAIRSKKEMLISLGAHMRAELEGDPSLRELSRGANRR